MIKKLFGILFVLSVFFLAYEVTFAAASYLNVTTKTPDSCTGTCGSVVKTVYTTVTLNKARYSPGEQMVVTTTVNPNWTSNRTGTWTNTNSPGVQVCFSVGTCGCPSIPANFGPYPGGYCYQEFSTPSPVAGWYTALESTALQTNSITLTAPQTGSCELKVRLVDYSIFTPGLPYTVLTVPCEFDEAPNAPTITPSQPTAYRNIYSFAVRATDPNNDPVRYEVDTDNNGTVDLYLPSQNSYVNSGLSRSFTISWDTLGEKSYRARAIDSTGKASAWVTQSTTVVNQAPTVSITGPTSGSPNSTYTFTVTGDDGDWSMDQIRYEIDKDNNGTVDVFLPGPSSYVPLLTSQTFTNTWPTTGIKTMTIWAVDNLGMRSSPVQHTIDIGALVITGPTTGYMNTPYTYTLTASSGGDSQIRYEVDWSGVGTAGTPDVYLPGPSSYVTSGTSQSSSRSWPQRGAQTVKGRVIGSPSGTVGPWVTYNVNIVNRVPLAPTITPAQGNTNLPNQSQNFTLRTTDPDGDGIYYQIDWGDGGGYGGVNFEPAASGANVSVAHTYAQSRTYTIKVRAYDDYQPRSYSAETEYSYAMNFGVISPPSISGPNSVYLFSDYTHVPVGGPYAGVNGGYRAVYSGSDTPVRLEFDFSDTGVDPVTNPEPVVDFVGSRDVAGPLSAVRRNLDISYLDDPNSSYWIYPCGSIRSTIEASNPDCNPDGIMYVNFPYTWTEKNPAGYNYIKVRAVGYSGARSPWVTYRVGIGEVAACPLYLTADPSNDHRAGNPQNFIVRAQGYLGAQLRTCPGGPYGCAGGVPYADLTTEEQNELLVNNKNGVSAPGSLRNLRIDWSDGSPYTSLQTNPLPTYPIEVFYREFIGVFDLDKITSYYIPNGGRIPSEHTFNSNTWNAEGYRLFNVVASNSTQNRTSAHASGEPAEPAGTSCQVSCQYAVFRPGVTVSNVAGTCGTTPQPPTQLTASCALLYPPTNTEPYAPGNWIMWETTASGGAAPYTYAWSGATQVANNPRRARITATSPGTYGSTVTVQDFNGTQYTATCPSVLEQSNTSNLSVSIGASKEGENTFSASGVTVRVGQSADIRTIVDSDQGLLCQSSGSGFDRESASVRNPASGFTGTRVFTTQPYTSPGQYSYSLSCTDDDTPTPAARSVTVTAVPVPVFNER